MVNGKYTVICSIILLIAQSAIAMYLIQLNTLGVSL